MEQETDSMELLLDSAGPISAIEHHQGFSQLEIITNGSSAAPRAWGHVG